MYLDLKKIADAYNKKEQGWEDVVAAEVQLCFTESKNAISQTLKEIQEMVLYWQGEQYLTYNDTIDQYEPLPDNEYTSYIPRPMDNLLSTPVETIVSMLIQNKPIANVIQNSDKSQDRNRAKLAESILNAKYDIDGEQRNYEKAFRIGTICRNAYRKDYWDTSGMQTVQVDIMLADGTKQVVEKPLGDNAVKILTPFEITPDIKNSVDCIDDGLFIFEDQEQPIDFIKSQFDKTEDGYTGFAKDIQADMNTSISFTYLDALRGSDKSNNNTSGKYGTLIECYTRPIPEAPQGYKIVMCSGKLLFMKPSIYTYEDGTNWHPYSEWRYKIHPLRHYGICLLDPLLPIQKRYNSILALEALTRETMAIPQWLVPNGSIGVEDYPTGEPGLIVPFDSINGEKPQRIDGKGLSPTVYREKDSCEQKIQQIAGTNDILQGSRPQGVSTATELNMLLEQSMSVHSPKIQGAERFIAISQGKKLNLIRRMYEEPRQTLINRVKALNSDNREVEINDFFTGQELGDNIDVRIEAGSSLPKLKSAQRSNLMEAYQAQLLGDLTPMGNPSGNRLFLQKMGIEQFPTSNNDDLKRAEWENDLLRQGNKNDVKALPTDNQLLHFMAIIGEVKRPEFFDSNTPEIVAMYNEHAMEHWKMMEDPEKMQVLGSQKRALIVEQAQNIYGLGYGQPPQPPIEERVTMLEQQVGNLSQFAEQAGQLIQTVAPDMGGQAVAPARQEMPGAAGLNIEGQEQPPMMA